MTSPRDLPLEARRAAWDALWKILLAPPSPIKHGASGPVDIMGKERRDEVGQP